MRDKQQNVVQWFIALASIANKHNCGGWCFFLERFLPWEIGKLWGGKNQAAIAFIPPMFKWIVPCLGSMILSNYFEWYIWMDQKIEIRDGDAGKDCGQKQKSMEEDEMVKQHHQLNGHESEKTPGDNEGQGSLAWCSLWGCEESDMT